VADDKRELTFRHLFPGDMLGEECFVDRGKRGAQAEAMMTSILCLMSARDFRRIAREEKELSYAVARRLCERVHEVEQVLSETVFKTVRGRIASGLFRLYQAVPQGGQSGIRVTHQEIANLAGSTRETTTVVLHSFREEGILDIANRRVTVLDPLALEHAARSG
jgi:CRP-like cAMP-binding protein